MVGQLGDRLIVELDHLLQVERRILHLFVGAEFRAKGEPERAVPDYDLVLKINPSDAYAFHNRGLAYRDLRDYDRAIKDFDQAVKINPNLIPAYNDRGLAYVSKGETDRAIEDFDHAIMLNPARSGGVQ